MSKFQIVIIGLFGAFILVGVFVVATVRSSNSGPVFSVSIWGPISNVGFSQILQETGLDKNEQYNITYRFVNPASFDSLFVSALAEGRGPDLFFLPQDSIVKHYNKIYPIPYDRFPRRTFTDTFIQEGELYLSPQGILGLPISIDPLVMYWNRTTFSNRGVPQPPRYWDEFKSGLAQLFTERGQGLEIRRSALPFGEYSNVSNASAILSALIMQSGSEITQWRSDGGVSVSLNQSSGGQSSPATAALDSYTEFSNPQRPLYTWSRAMPPSQEVFISGNLATYFGFASEVFEIQDKNPNLNFDVTTLPQARGATASITYGRMYALAIPKMSPNSLGAFQVATILTSATGARSFSNITGLPPVRRDLLATRPTEDPYLAVFYTSALWARGWLEPSAGDVQRVFREMVESVTGGRERVSAAVSKANAELKLLLER